MKRQIIQTLGIMVCFFVTTVPSFADVKNKAQEPSENTKSVQTNIDKHIQGKIDKKLRESYSEAVKAIAQTKKALVELSSEKPDIKKTLEALTKSTGQLEILLAREPELDLATIDVGISAHDLTTDIVSVKAMIHDAKNYIDDGEIQKARAMLANLVSEIDINIVSVPMATYPIATKEAAALISEGKIEEAKIVLQTQLNSLVETTEIIPLPTIRASFLLKKAEKLVEKDKRNEKENQKLTRLLKDARNQLNMGELLGYATKSKYKKLHSQIDEIEKKIGLNESGKGWFDKIKKQLSELY